MKHPFLILKRISISLYFTLTLSPLLAEWKPSDIANAAKWQINKTTSYDPSYVSLDYPGGDIALEKGVCTDVIIRALRKAASIDLQRLVHEDMKTHFSQYPKIWGLKRPDKNIDHRRVPNLQSYFKRMNYELPLSQNAAQYQAGDIVTCIVPPNLAHIMIISDTVGASGTPCIIHNIGAGTRLEDALFRYKLTGHYRITQP